MRPEVEKALQESNAWLAHLDALQRLPDGGYTMPPDTRAVMEPYLARYGFSLSRLATMDELLSALGHCNSQDFEKLLRKPAPAPGLRFLWNRLRKLVQ